MMEIAVGWGAAIAGRALVLAILVLCIWGIKSLVELAAREVADLWTLIRWRERRSTDDTEWRFLGIPFYLLSVGTLGYIAVWLFTVLLGGAYGSIPR